MDFLETIKENLLRNKMNFMMSGILLMIILGSNWVLYYVLDKEIKEIDKIEESPIIWEKEEEKEEKVTDSVRYKVDIKGFVNHPGVYEASPDTRVIDIIQQAGGLLEEADVSVNNLSKKVQDEMVIVIYSKDEVENFKKTLEEEKQVEQECIVYNELVENDSCKDDLSSSNHISNENISFDERDIKISINLATQEELMTLPGIGEAKAKSIIEYRESIGEFHTIEELMNVSGIGESIFEKIKDYITVE